MKRLRWIRTCVQKWARRATDRAQRLTRDVVVGMVLSGSVVLCEIARALNPTKQAFLTILQRLSTNLADEDLAGEVALVARDYLADAGRVTQGEYEYVLINPTGHHQEVRQEDALPLHGAGREREPTQRAEAGPRLVGVRDCRDDAGPSRRTAAARDVVHGAAQLPQRDGRAA